LRPPKRRHYHLRPPHNTPPHLRPASTSADLHPRLRTCIAMTAATAFAALLWGDVVTTELLTDMLNGELPHSLYNLLELDWQQMDQPCRHRKFAKWLGGFVLPMKLKLITERESFAAERTAFADERTAFAKQQTAFAQERIEWEKTKSHLEKAFVAEKAAHKGVEVKLSPHLQSDACIATTKADVWIQGIAKKRKKSSLHAEADLYEPVCALLSSLIAKTQRTVIDTHDTAYLNNLKPDITVCAPMITCAHGAYARIIMELKSRGVALDASCRGQLLNYMYAQANMQLFRARFTGLLSNIDDNVFIVMERKRDGSTHAWAYAPVRFDRAVEFLMALVFDDSETPLHPHFSSGLGKIQQHLGMSTNNVVASFRLRKPPPTDDSWYWTDVGLEAGKKQAICVKRSTV
ncbi:hypothetical protein FN846DRAFT_1006463, partial [Sphaerosporella brunnea]